jgi:hypothetical protein
LLLSILKALYFLIVILLVHSRVFVHQHEVFICADSVGFDQSRKLYVTSSPPHTYIC